MVLGLPATGSPVESTIDSPLASRWSVSPARRFCDVAVSVLVLVLFSLPMLAIALLVRLSSPGPAIFVQDRVGRCGKLFSIYKFRTMTASGASSGPTLTRDGDSRITPLGRMLRKLKLDELPQFWNVLRGDMSLIGPRPKLPQYAAIRNMPFRPGITGAATLAFRKEEEVLRHIHPALLEQYYNQHIRPLKASIDLNYMANATWLSDLRVLAATVLACIAPAAHRNPLAEASLAQSRDASAASPQFNNGRGFEQA